MQGSAEVRAKPVVVSSKARTSKILWIAVPADAHRRMVREIDDLTDRVRISAAAVDLEPNLLAQIRGKRPQRAER